MTRRYFVAVAFIIIIIGIPPHIIMQGMPIAIIEFMASQRSFMRGIIDASVGIIFIIMPSLVISHFMVHVIGIIMPFMPFIIGIIIGMPFIMPFMPPIIGIIMPFMPPIIGIIIGVPFMPFIMPFIIGIIIGMGIMLGVPPIIWPFIVPFIMGIVFIIGIAFMGISIRKLASWLPDVSSRVVLRTAAFQVSRT